VFLNRVINRRAGLEEREKNSEQARGRSPVFVTMSDDKHEENPALDARYGDIYAIHGCHIVRRLKPPIISDNNHWYYEEYSTD
jgi:hypothetical protein